MATKLQIKFLKYIYSCTCISGQDRASNGGAFLLPVCRRKQGGVFSHAFPWQGEFSHYPHSFSVDNSKANKSCIRASNELCCHKC